MRGGMFPSEGGMWHLRGHVRSLGACAWRLRGHVVSEGACGNRGGHVATEGACGV